MNYICFTFLPGTFLFIGLLFGFVSNAAAIEVIDTDVRAINSETVLHTITFEVGFLNADVWVPILATSDDVSDAPFAVSYTTEDSAAYTAAVISDAEIIGDRYYVARGDNKQFTLAVFAKQSMQSSGASSVTVTNAPMNMRKNQDETIFDFKLSTDVLTAFTTKVDQ